MARREEKIELNPGGAWAEVCMHDVLGPLRPHHGATEFTRAGIGVRIRVASAGQSILSRGPVRVDREPQSSREPDASRLM